MYVVICDFCDLQDERYFYRAGDEFPRPGKKVSKERIEELLSTGNKSRKKLIAPMQRRKKNAGTNSKVD